MSDEQGSSPTRYVRFHSVGLVVQDVHGLVQKGTIFVSDDHLNSTIFTIY